MVVKSRRIRTRECGRVGGEGLSYWEYAVSKQVFERLSHSAWNFIDLIWFYWLGSSIVFLTGKNSVRHHSLHLFFLSDR